MRLPVGRVGWLLVATVVGCGDEFGGFDVRYFGIDLSVDDSVLFRGDRVQMRAVAPCSLDACVPRPSEILWSSSNPARATVDEFGGVTAGGDTGGVLIRARFREFADSQYLRVVDRGSPRWRAQLSAEVSTAAASVGLFDTAIAVLVVHGVGPGSGLLRRLSLDGARVWEVGTCPATAVAPSVGAVVVVSGAGCTRAHEAAGGATEWSLSLGAGAAGAAQLRTARWVVAHVVGPGVPGDPVALVVSRLTTTGAEARRDTVTTASGLETQLTPVVAANGDAVVGWSAGGLSRVARVDSLGRIAFVRDLPAPAVGAPAFGANGMLLFGTEAGLVALDSAGTFLWEVRGAGVRASPPVVDNDGHVYVQATTGLGSFTAAGVERWRADSLGSGTASVSPAPVVLQGGELLAVCKGSQHLCWVDRATGAVRASVALDGAVAATPAVAGDGTAIVVVGAGRAGSGLPALAAYFGRFPALSVGWPAEGRTMTRSRSLRP